MIRFRGLDSDGHSVLKTAFYTETTKRGVLFHPNHCWFLSLGHTKEDVDRTLEVSRESLRKAKEAYKR